MCPFASISRVSKSCLVSRLMRICRRVLFSLPAAAGNLVLHPEIEGSLKEILVFYGVFFFLVPDAASNLCQYIDSTQP
jgi:hypothetical protein